MESKIGEVDKARFNKAWPKLLADLQADKKLRAIPDAACWLNQVLEMNVPNGKKNRGLALIYVYNSIVKNPTEEDQFLADVYGWIVEIGQAAALIADDFMDGSETRRGNICWYKEEGVGIFAINDTLMLENIIYFIIYKYFSRKPTLPKLLELTHDIMMKTIFGQTMDTKFQFGLDNCNIENYRRTVDYKTGFYTFYLPFACALALAGVEDKSLYELVEDVSLEMGYLFQVQDDYLDCYGNPAVTGKIGTDIVDGKRSWLLVKALERVSKDQMETLKENYGKKCMESEREVKILYDQLGMRRVFYEFEKETYFRLGQRIQQFPNNLPKNPFLAILQTIYKRNK